jgi:glyoxylase-like metal-dependent hydrolase (beta-lactamase superfamily II)
MSLDQTKLELRTRAVGPWPMNAYVLVCPATRQSLLIDPGAEPETLLDLLAGTQPVGILLTHTHPDHLGALDEMRAWLKTPVMAHPGPHFEGLILEAERPLNHGDLVRVGDFAVRVYHTPGHVPDMLCFALEGDPRVVVGDTIFEGGPGKTWSAEDFQTTLQTLRQVILAWPDETVCYPGHGPHFRLGDRRAAIEAFLRKDHGEFFGDATWDQ